MAGRTRRRPPVRRRPTLREAVAARVLPWWYPWEERLLGLAGRPLGERGERLAARYLAWIGLTIVARSHATPLGEVDLIADEGGVTVFVEVKTRAQTGRGRPEEAVTPAKQRAITRLAAAYLARRGLTERPARFDVVAIVWPAGGRPTILHLRSAFEATGPETLRT